MHGTRCSRFGHLLSTWLQRCVPVPIWGHGPQHPQTRFHNRPGEELPEHPRTQTLPRGRIPGGACSMLDNSDKESRGFPISVVRIMYLFSRDRTPAVTHKKCNPPSEGATTLWRRWSHSSHHTICVCSGVNPKVLRPMEEPRERWSALLILISISAMLPRCTL